MTNENRYSVPRYFIPAAGRNPVTTLADKDPREDEPVYPREEHDDDEGVADGMCDDDADDDRAPAAFLPWALGIEQPSPWDEAIARLSVSRFRGDSP